MKYNSPHSTAACGAMAKDWEQGIDYSRLSKERLARAQSAIRYAGLGAVLCFNFDNIRYVTATHIGEWARDKFFRYALCPAEGKPFLWDPAPPAKRISSPWISDNVAAPITTMQGAIPPSMNVQHDFAKQIKKALVHYGIDKEPLGIDMMEIGMLRALEAEGIEVVDGQQALLDAREIKTGGRDRTAQDGGRRWSMRLMSTSAERSGPARRRTNSSPSPMTGCSAWAPSASNA